MTYDFTLPPAYTTARLQNLDAIEHTRLLPQVFALAREQYPEWPAEQLQNWLAALAGSNDNGTKMAVSVVLDAQGQVAATSAIELYHNGTAMINYSLARKDANNYAALIYAATKDMAAGIKALQARGETIHFVGKEHHLKSLRAIAGYYAVDQVPLDGPTSLLTKPVKYYEVAETYAKEHSIFREKNYQLDPGYLSLNQLADHLPATATYQQAVRASARSAAQRMGLKNE
jgi:hypothetical protein